MWFGVSQLSIFFINPWHPWEPTEFSRAKLGSNSSGAWQRTSSREPRAALGSKDKKSSRTGKNLDLVRFWEKLRLSGD